MLISLGTDGRTRFRNPWGTDGRTRFRNPWGTDGRTRFRNPHMETCRHTKKINTIHVLLNPVTRPLQTLENRQVIILNIYKFHKIKHQLLNSHVYFVDIYNYGLKHLMLHCTLFFYTQIMIKPERHWKATTIALFAKNLYCKI